MMEPMTGIEPAYSAWEVFSAFEHPFTSPQVDAVAGIGYTQVRIGIDAGFGTVLNASDSAPDGWKTLSDAAPARPRLVYSGWRA